MENNVLGDVIRDFPRRKGPVGPPGRFEASETRARTRRLLRYLREFDWKGPTPAAEPVQMTARDVIRDRAKW